jgi:hypothetical protein
MCENVVKEGDTVIVKMHDELDTMMRVISSTEQKIGKGRVDVSPLVGAPYGSVFEIRGRKLLKIDAASSQSEGQFETPNELIVCRVCHVSQCHSHRRQSIIH